MLLRIPLLVSLVMRSLTLQLQIQSCGVKQLFWWKWFDDYRWIEFVSFPRGINKGDISWVLYFIPLSSQSLINFWDVCTNIYLFVCFHFLTKILDKREALIFIIYNKFAETTFATIRESYWIAIRLHVIYALYQAYMQGKVLWEELLRDTNPSWTHNYLWCIAIQMIFEIQQQIEE